MMKGEANIPNKGSIVEPWLEKTGRRVRRKHVPQRALVPLHNMASLARMTGNAAFRPLGDRWG